MTAAERAAKVEALRQRRAARGDADPLNRLTFIMAIKIATGEATIITEQKED